MVVGILALQGNYAQHFALLTSIAHSVPHYADLRLRFLRTTSDCTDTGMRLDGIVLPGGESSTMAYLLGRAPLFRNALADHIRKVPVLATCAGTILLAKKILGPTSEIPLNVFPIANIEVRRNGYGRQTKSFTARTKGEKDCHGLFIRAPLIENTHSPARILSRYQKMPVIVQHENLILSTFHPEAIGECALHMYFLDLIRMRSSDFYKRDSAQNS